MTEEDDAVRERSAAARVGVTLLNLLAPGVGLVRVGRSRLGLGFAAATVIWLLLLAAAAALLPTLTPRGFIVMMVVSLLVAATLLIAPLAMTWRSSRVRRELSWWRRWYALLAVIVACQLATTMLVDMLHGFYKPFYMPAESMEPTLSVGDRLVADMRRGAAPRRGEVILLTIRDTMYVKRVVALPGDRIAMVAGVPILNGVPARQRRIGVTEGSGRFDEGPAEIRAERLPGGSSEYRIIDAGPSAYDDMEERTVPARHVFVLGDNRDRSADSRVPRELMGVEMLPVGDIAGRPLFRTWSGDWRWLGTPIR